MNRLAADSNKLRTPRLITITRVATHLDSGSCEFRIERRFQMLSRCCKSRNKNQQKKKMKEDTYKKPAPLHQSQPPPCILLSSLSDMPHQPIVLDDFRRAHSPP